MTQMESPKRKMQKKNDYQRHKLFRKIKRRRKAQAEAEQHIAEKQLKKKLKLPKFGGGKTREVYTSDIHFNNDAAGGGIDRYGNEFDYVQLPETVVTARKIPTFKDIEKQIGRKITQGEIDKVVAVDPEIPIQAPKSIEKGMYSPSVTNEFINTVAGTAGDATNYLANKAGLSNLAPDEQLIETRDGDALFDLPVYGQAAKLGLYGLGRYGGKFGLKALQNLARKKLLEREFTLSNVDKQLAKNIAYSKPGYDHELIISPSKKQKRLQLSQPTYQVYTGNKHKISEVIDDSGNVNLANLLKIQNEALSNVPGGRLARHRLENPDWHKTDWNTFLHSRDAYQRALQAGYPNEALFPTLMHDAGKLWAGDGHGPYGASIVKQIFPDATDEQIMAIYQHMDKVPESDMGKLVKGADIKEPNQYRKLGLKDDYDSFVISDEDFEELGRQRIEKEKEAEAMIYNGINAWSGKYFNSELNNIPDESKYIFDKTIYPRMTSAQKQAYNSSSGAAKEQFTAIDDAAFDANQEPKSLQAMYLPDFRQIIARKSAKDPLYINHEHHHYVDDVVGQTKVQKDLYKQAYQARGLNVDKDNIGKYYDDFPIEERPTTNSDIRNQLLNRWQMSLSVDDQNKLIDNISIGKLLQALDFSQYTRTVKQPLQKLLKEDPKAAMERVQYIKNALKYAPALSPFVLGYGDYDSYNSGKDIHIKKSKRGTFTKAAKAHGMSVQGFANKVLKNPSKYSAAMRKKANFARNAASWKH